MNLVDFIIKAKISGYATAGEKQELKFDDGSFGFKFESDGYKYPFRGPAKLEKGNLVYQNQQNGTLEGFSGFETIYDRNKKVYYLHYHGGTMKKST